MRLDIHALDRSITLISCCLHKTSAAHFNCQLDSSFDLLSAMASQCSSCLPCGIARRSSAATTWASRPIDPTRNGIATITSRDATERAAPALYSPGLFFPVGCRDAVTLSQIFSSHPTCSISTLLQYRLNLYACPDSVTQFMYCCTTSGLAPISRGSSAYSNSLTPKQDDSSQPLGSRASRARLKSISS